MTAMGGIEGAAKKADAHATAGQPAAQGPPQGPGSRSNARRHVPRRPLAGRRAVAAAHGRVRQPRRQRRPAGGLRPAGPPIGRRFAAKSVPLERFKGVLLPPSRRVISARLADPG